MNKLDKVGQNRLNWTKMEKMKKNGQFRQKMTNDRTRKKFLEARCDARFLKKAKSVFICVVYCSNLALFSMNRRRHFASCYSKIKIN